MIIPTINYHLNQIEKSGEIQLSDAIRKIRIPSYKWSSEVMMDNLDLIIAVGLDSNRQYNIAFQQMINI